MKSYIAKNVLKAMRFGLICISFVGTVATGITAQTNPDPWNAQYLVEFKGSSLPDDFAARIAALGGQVVDLLPELNVAVVAGLSDENANRLRQQSDVSDVTNDDPISPIGPSIERPSRAPQIEITAQSAANPETAMFYPYEWHMRAIGADRAWRAGYLGDPGVRVAIIDSGLDPTHPELLGHIDFSSSRSFCAREDGLVQQEFPGYPAWTDLLGHGTAVGSVVVSNANLLAGMTTRSTLMAFKAIGVVNCPASGLFRSIYSAANGGADVINLSLGSPFPPPRAGQKGFAHYYHLAFQYALVKGVSAVVVAAGNSGIDLDHDGNAYSLFCDTPGVICVSATGPTDTGPQRLGPFVNVDTPAFYTNFGASAIDVAAPGGNLVFDANGNIIGEGYVSVACATTDREFDANGNLVPGFCSGGGYLAAAAIGTSFASPHVAGLAALVVARIGHGKAAQVRAMIENSADDLGKPGADPFYGKGRINVPKALGLE
jgi:subtilisin family serine protease